MVIVVLWLRRRRPQILDNERVVGENIVRYDDEGGGEEDTEAFDLFALRHLNQRHLTSGPNESRTHKSHLFQKFIRERLQEADLDPTAPPLDSLQTYTLEGRDLAAESLDSLDSLTLVDPLTLLESEHSYASQRAWGPRFREGHSFSPQLKLARDQT